MFAIPAYAGEMKPEEAQRFVAGKVFAYSCSDGTTGAGRIHADGAVAGSIRIAGTGQARYVALPSGTIKVSSSAICASLKGVPFSPCFNVVQTSANSFRGSVSGFGFAYCDFVRQGTSRIRTADAPPPRPRFLRPKTVAERDTVTPAPVISVEQAELRTSIGGE